MLYIEHSYTCISLSTLRIIMEYCSPPQGLPQHTPHYPNNCVYQYQCLKCWTLLRTKRWGHQVICAVYFLEGQGRTCTRKVGALFYVSLVTSQGYGVRYFVVDCRPLDQYSCGHLPGSFQLDPNLVSWNSVIYVGYSVSTYICMYPKNHLTALWYMVLLTWLCMYMLIHWSDTAH